MVIRYHELMGGNYSPSVGGIWEDWDLTTYGVPGACVVEVMIRHPKADGAGAFEAIAGIRENGSALTRTTTISPYAGTAQMAIMRCNVDADGVIEIRDSYLSFPANPHAIFNVIGYFLGATYTETNITLNKADATWTEDDLYTDHSIPKGRVVDVLMGVQDENGVQDIGLREQGATGRTYHMKDVWYVYGVNSVSVFEVTNTTNGKIETYCDRSADASFKCFGYWDNTVDYTVVKQILVPSGAASWVDFDLNTYSIPDKSVGVFILFNHENATVNTMGVREDGSSLSRYVNIDRGELSGVEYYATCVTLCCEVTTANSRVELYTTDTTYAYLWFDGYLKDNRSEVAKINGVSISSLSKINGVAVGDIIAINGMPI